MRYCPRCRIPHEPEWYKEHYTAWYFAYIRFGHSKEKSAKLALAQIQKHSPGAPTPIPLWMKAGIFLGVKDMNYVKKGWDAIDGKKTAIGAILTFLVVLGPEVHKLAIELGVTQEGLAYVTAGIAVVGAAHKVWKKYFGAAPTDGGN